MPDVCHQKSGTSCETPLDTHTSGRTLRQSGSGCNIVSQVIPREQVRSGFCEMVFPTADQMALTITRLLVEQIIPHHGVPVELLSDRGATFLSNLMKEVCQLMNIHKVNKTAYHPQTNRLVERFNRTLTDMLAKTVDRSGRN